MRILKLTEKTGFINKDFSTPIVIRDQRGLRFYDTNGLNAPEFFNLPPGKFNIDSGSFQPLAKPVKYNLVPLPWPQRNRPKPFNYKVVFGNNPNKCSILWDRGIIFYDNSFKKKPLPICDFVLFHEYSHACYETEKYADLMAGNYMLRMGYNPSQIGESPLDSLSPKQYERQYLMIKNMIKYAKRPRK